jgi:PPOX class probable F420-dependent enzyme
MSSTIPTNFLDLFERKSFAHLATVMPNGSPQVSPVWVDFDGTFVLINSENGRQKDKNMRRDAHVAVEIHDPDDPYRYLLVRGKVEEITLSGASEHIDKLAMRYTGAKYAWRNPNSPRVLYKIRPMHVSTSR